MIARTYLVTLALLYFCLAIWCSISPKVTSQKVGFELIGGSGKSEFMTVYGGLEFGIALVLAAAVFHQGSVSYGVVAATLIHGSLVVFRTISFFCYSDISSFTYKLAAGEWVITVLGVGILLLMRAKP